MAIAATTLTDSGSESDTNAYSTASVSPTGNALILACVATRGVGGVAGDTPTSVTGNGLTWEEVDSHITNSVRVSIFRAMGASPSSGAVTFNFSGNQGNATWAIVQVTGVTTGGSNGADAVVQPTTNGGTATSGTVTLSTFLHANNRPFAFFAIEAAEGLLPSNFTELSDNNTGAPVHASAAEWHDTTADTTADYSWTSSVPWAAIALELNETVLTPPTPGPRLRVVQSNLRW